MLVAVQAYEGMYQGLHGIKDEDILEVDSIEEINEWGNEASTNLIYSYGLEDEYLETVDEDDEDACIENSYYYTDRGWTAYKVKEDTGLSVEELSQELSSIGYDSFVKKYCAEALDL